MSFRSRFAALVFGVSAPVRAARGPRAISTIVDGQVAGGDQVMLHADERQAIELMARTHVERTSHFDVPRFSA